MKAIAAVLSCGLAVSMAAPPVLAEFRSDRLPDRTLETDEGPDRIVQLVERDDGGRAGEAGPQVLARRALKPDDLAAVLALLFLGQVPKGAQAGMAVQLSLK